MLTCGATPEYLFRRTGGVIGLLRRLIEGGCTEAMARGRERLTTELLDGAVIRPEQLGDLDALAGEVPAIPALTRPQVLSVQDRYPPADGALGHDMVCVKSTTATIPQGRGSA
ncbi:hypothetical protein [Kitasatospora sp. NPDC091276]|uniref:hypothetical protein n=1 Tax=Kitasatospora sp. NPDC091276 TaxID=3155300 RepID=UPI0034457333